MIRALLCLIVAIATSAGEELRLQLLTPVAVPGHFLAVRVHGELPLTSGPVLLQLRLGAKDRAELSRRQVFLAHPRQLAVGVVFHLPLPPEIPVGSLQLSAESSAGNRQWQSRSLDVPTWHGLGQQLAALHAQLPKPTPDGQRLLLEQCLLHLRDGADPQAAAPLQERLRSLAALQQMPPAGVLPPAGSSHEVARRCPIDGSVQPLRLHRCPGPARGLVVLLRQLPTDLAKHRWPALPSLALSQASARQLDLLEIYPAGDLQWLGISRIRLRHWLDELRLQPAYAELPLLFWAEGPAAAAALAEIRYRLPQCRGLLLQAPGLGHLQDPLWGQRHLDTFAALPIALAGTQQGDGPAQIFADLHQRRYGAWQELPAGLEAGSSWAWLAARAALPLPSQARSYRVEAPEQLLTTAGRLQVWQLEQWRQPGLLQLASDGSVLSSQGLQQVGYGPPEAALARPSKSYGQATGPAAGYARRPFTVIVGSGEHAAAGAANHALAQRLLDDWVAHAQGAPVWCLDTDFDPAAHAGRNLICIGNPRSNRVLAQLWPQLVPQPPLRWDHRSLQWAEEPPIIRQQLSLGLVWPLDAGERLLLILDGVADWPAGGLPLAGRADLHLAEAGALRLEFDFDSTWRRPAPPPPR